MPRVKKIETDFAPPAAEAVLEPPKGPSCILDRTDEPAKIVVVINELGEKTPILATGAGEQAIARDDLAWKLPSGAKLQRVRGRIVATHLDRPDLTPMDCATAVEAIRAFPDYLDPRAVND